MQSWAEINRWRRAQRASLIARRQAIPQDERRRLRPLILGHVEQQLPELAIVLIGFYWPFRGEIGPHPLVRWLVERGAGAALPVAVEKGQPLEFWASRPGAPLRRGIWDIPIPTERYVVQPTALLVPLVGFDDVGYRLGYGGGYHDRTLALTHLRPLTIGVGYELGLLPTIYPQPRDVPMDAVVTEAGLVKSPPWLVVTTRDSGASRASPLAWDEDPNGTGAYASPLCFMHEFDLAHLGLQRNPDHAPADSMAGRKAAKARRHRRTARNGAEGGAPKMSSKTAGIPRYRRFDGPALLSQGFRPFFLGAGVWALAAMVLWIAILQGAVLLPTAFDPVAWHVHEMLFGFVIAAIAGFLLTAIPNWAGRMPLQGVPLAVLVGVWLAGRLAVGASAWIGAGIAAVLDLSFLTLLLGVVLREILAGRNWRNLPMPVVLGGLLGANALTHADAVGLAATGPLGQRLGIGIVILLIGLVGGRIIPSFTLNWLKKRGESNLPASFGPLDRGALGLAAAALAIWVVVPESPIGGAALIAAGVASLVRLARWRGHLTLAEPLVWSLHLGFVWVGVGLLLAGLSAFLPDVPLAAGLHGLTVGAMGGMTVAVMTRATLGHTGRPLTANRWTAAIYLLIAAAATLRVAVPFLADVYLPLLWTSGLAWITAFGLFVVHYGRILSR